MFTESIRRRGASNFVRRSRRVLANAIETLETRVLFASAYHEVDNTNSKMNTPQQMENLTYPNDLLVSEGGFYSGFNGTNDGQPTAVATDGQRYGGQYTKSPTSSTKLITMYFPVSAAEKAAILANPTGIATFTMTAARDLGYEMFVDTNPNAAANQGVSYSAASDYITAKSATSGVTIDDMFSRYKSTVPRTYNSATGGSAATAADLTPKDFVNADDSSKLDSNGNLVAPNFSSDNPATAISNSFTGAQLAQMIGTDNRIGIDLYPLGGMSTAGVGRVKIYSATLDLAKAVPIVTANDDSTTTTYQTPVRIPVLANDTDSQSEPLYIASVSTPSKGTVTIDRAGSVTNRTSQDVLVYRPANNSSGTVTFTYTAGDGDASTDTATVTVLVKPAPTTTYLSSLTPTFQKNGYGPYEKDHSNGEDGAHDGHTITLGGQTFARGLGVHAASELDYNLAGNYDTFQSVVGIDDETGGQGSVEFKVFADGKLLFDSTAHSLIQTPGGAPTLPGEPQILNLKVTGVNTLRLVVGDAGDGNNFDHADWADAKLTSNATNAFGNTFVSDLTPTVAQNGWGSFEKDRSNGELGDHDGGTITLNGTKYSKGLGVHALSEISYDISGQNYLRFGAAIGVDDEVGSGGSVDFQIWVDGFKKYDSGRMTGSSATKLPVVDVTGGKKLTLIVTDAGDGNTDDHADWGNALLYTV